MLPFKFFGHIVVSAVLVVRRVVDILLNVVVFRGDLAICVQVVEGSVVMTRWKRARARRELDPFLVGPVSELVKRHIEAGHSKSATYSSQTSNLHGRPLKKSSPAKPLVMRGVALAVKRKVVFERLNLLLQLAHSIKSMKPIFSPENVMFLLILHANKEIVDQPDEKAKTNNYKHSLTKRFPRKWFLKAHDRLHIKVCPSNHSFDLRITRHSLPFIKLLLIVD